MPSRISRRLAAVSMLVAAPGLSGCGIGFGVQTDQPYQPSVGNNERGESVDVLGATVVLPYGSNGTFSASLVNRDPESEVTLTGITGDGVQVQLLEDVAVGPESLLNLSETGAVLVTFDDDAIAGGYTRLTLQFDNGESVEINTPIVNDEEEFADVVPAEAPDEATAGETEAPS